MKNRIVSAILAIIVVGIPLRAEQQKMDFTKIENVTNMKGNYNQSEGVFKITSPRNDMEISVDQWKMPPFMGLTSWASFKLQEKAPTMVMGDLVLFEDEVNFAMTAALNNGLEVTALHNHFFFDQPKVYFMHIGGEGRMEDLAQGVRATFDAVKAVRAAEKMPSKTFGGTGLPKKSSITPKLVEDILKTKGEAKEGMYKAVFGREVKMACGCTVGNTMGVNTWAAFAGSDDNALVDGDFAVLENELQPVLKSLRASGINIVAIHQHMVGESPRMLFLHYWGRGSVQQLAKSIKDALNLQQKS